MRKELLWLSGEVKTPPFSSAARVEAGTLIRRLQRGDKIGLPHSRPMQAIGRRCHELRIPDGSVTWRIVYRIDTDAIVIGDVFKKKTRTTPVKVIANCKQRFKHYDEVTK